MALVNAIAAYANALLDFPVRRVNAQRWKLTACRPTPMEQIKYARDMELVNAMNVSATIHISENSVKVRRGTKRSIRYVIFMSHVYSVSSTESWVENVLIIKRNAHQLRRESCINPNFMMIFRVRLWFLWRTFHLWKLWFFILRTN